MDDDAHRGDTWLLVWAEPGDAAAHAGQALAAVDPVSDDAHTVLSREVEGERWSLLLVHYTDAECRRVAAALRGTWTYGFVNAVVDLGEPRGSVPRDVPPQQVNAR